MRDSLIDTFMAKVDAGSCCYNEWFLDKRAAGTAVDALVEWLRQDRTPNEGLDPIDREYHLMLHLLADELESK